MYMVIQNIKFRDVGNTEFISHANKYDITGAAISGGGSLIGGILSYQGSKYAAKKALQAVRETNQANRELAQYQNEWNHQHWKDRMSPEKPFLNVT